MARRVGRSEFAQEAIGFLLANYLRLVAAHEPLHHCARGSRRLYRGQDAADRGDVARAAPDDAVRAAGHDRADRGADLPPRGRRRAGRRPGTSRHHAGSRFRRSRRPAILQGRGARHARTHAPARIRRVGRADRRRAEGRPGRGTGHRDAGEAFGAADRPDRRRREPAHPVQHLGPRLARACRSAARSSSSATSSACPPTPTTPRWRRRGSPCRRDSTRRTGAPTPWSARPIRARI